MCPAVKSERKLTFQTHSKLVAFTLISVSVYKKIKNFIKMMQSF